MRPWLNTATRSDSVIASDWSWVTKTMVTPSSRCRRRISSCISSRSFLSSADSGSSISTTRGSNTSARASATRCCWPPESCCGLRSARCARRTLASAAATLSRIAPAGTLRTDSGKATFCATVMCGNSE